MSKIGLHRDFFTGIGMVIFGCAVFFLSTDIIGEAGYLPKALSVFMACMGAVVLYNGIRFTKKARAENTPHQYKIAANKIWVPMIVCLMIVGYVAMFQLLGFYVATAVFLVATLRYLRAGSWKRILLISGGYLLICFLLFSVFLKLPIYRIGLFGRFFRV